MSKESTPIQYWKVPGPLATAPKLVGIKIGSFPILDSDGAVITYQSHFKTELEAWREIAIRAYRGTLDVANRLRAARDEAERLEKANEAGQRHWAVLAQRLQTRAMELGRPLWSPEQVAGYSAVANFFVTHEPLLDPVSKGSPCADISSGTGDEELSRCDADGPAGIVFGG